MSRKGRRCCCSAVLSCSSFKKFSVEAGDVCWQDFCCSNAHISFLLLESSDSCSVGGNSANAAAVAIEIFLLSIASTNLKMPEQTTFLARKYVSRLLKPTFLAVKSVVLPFISDTFTSNPSLSCATWAQMRLSSGCFLSIIRSLRMPLRLPNVFSTDNPITTR